MGLCSSHEADSISRYYDIQENCILGEGTSSIVFRGVCRGTGEPVAIKRIEKNKNVTSSGIEDEIAFLKQCLHHANIISLRDVFKTQTHLFIVTELAEGGELFEALISEGPYSELDARRFVNDILEALKYLHSIHIVHRDLKPENLLLTSQNTKKARIKVADFSMAKVLNGSSLMERSRLTWAYCAPEIFREEYDEKSDLWSVGIILFVLLSATHPFDTDGKQSPEQIIANVQAGVFQMNDAIWEPISWEAKDLLQKLLEANPMQRLSAAEALGHVWFVAPNTSKEPLSSSIHGGLGAYQRRMNRKFRASVFATVAAGVIRKSMKKGEEQLPENDHESIDASPPTVENDAISLNKVAQEVTTELESLMNDVTPSRQVDKFILNYTSGNFSEPSTKKSNLLPVGNVASGACIEMENRLEIPTEFRSLFTKNQAEELVAQFQLSDADQSGFIDAKEFRDLLTRLSLHLTDEEAVELIENIDKDGNGLIDFRELVQMVVQIKKGDSKFRALRKLLDVLDTTPISLLEREAKKFQMTVTYELLEQRKATASFPATFLIELTISGKWCGPKGFEKLQAIGKTTREAKFKAAEAGIVRIKKLKPGLAYDIGVLPPEWQKWLYDNLEKGGKARKLMKILMEKGFSPSKNPTLMQRISCKASSLRLRKKQPIQEIYDAKIPGVLHPIWTHWCDEELKRGIEGKIIVEELVTLGFDKAKNPFLTQQLLRPANRAASKDRCCSPRNSPSEGNNKEESTSSSSDAPLYVYDFWKCVHENNLPEVELFVSAGYDVNEEKLDRHTKVALTPLLLACKMGYTKLVQFFLDQGAEVDKVNSFHRTPLMVAAQYGHRDIAEILLSKGASIFAQDHLDNTPLHMAAIGGSSKIAEMILNTHDNRLRMFIATIPKRKGRSYRALLKEAFTEIMTIKLRSNEKRRFHKNWLFDATKWIYQRVFQQIDRVVPEPKAFLMDHFVERYHGKFIIPDPEDDEANQLSEPSDYICEEEVEFYVDKCIREMYQNLRNKQGRTSLHIACEENLVCTHELLIQSLVDNYGCIPLLKDHSDKFPLEHLLGCRGRPGSPKGSIEYEFKLFSDREARKKAKEEKIEKEKNDARRKVWQQELDAVAANYGEFEVLVHANKHATVVQETEGWREFIEPETKNRFYMNIRSGRLQRSIPEKVLEYRKRRLVWKERLTRARLVERNGDWELYRPNQTDRYFFLHSKTKECVWRRPQEVTGWRTRKVEDDYLDEEELKAMNAQDHINDLVIPDNFDPHRVLKGGIETAATVTINNNPAITVSRILGEWEESFDTFLSGIVYFNLKTGEFQMEKPLEVEAEERARYAMVHIRSRSEDIEDHGAWTRYYDPVTKHTFYYNAETGEGKHDTCPLDFLEKSSRDKSSAKPLTAAELKIMKEKQELREILECTRRRENRGKGQEKEQKKLEGEKKIRQEFLDNLEASTEAAVKKEHSDRGGGYIAARFEREWEVRLIAEEHELITSARIIERNKKTLLAAKEIEDIFEKEELESAFIEDNDSLRAARERRRVSRILYRAIARLKMDMALCRWGCQSWMSRQRYIVEHEREECERRLMVCRLGCGMIKEDSQWQERLSNKYSCVIFNHEQTECSSRITKCSRDCGVWISLCKLDNHMKNLCLHRPIGDLPCRLGCGKIFQGGAHQVLGLEQERSCHECEECDLRKVDCTWPKCGNRILAKDRNKHRKSHLISAGIVSFLTAETHSFIVPRDVKKIKVQAWGAGGGSGYLKGQNCGHGGGGAFIEGVVKVFPGETIHIIIGSGGHEGCHAKMVQVNEKDEPRMEVQVGVARGGKPGGGVGHGGNKECAAGGGGGYTCIYRESAFGMEYILIAAGGGGGGTCRDGGGGESLKATKPVEGFDFRNGCPGGDQQGGNAGKCDESNPVCRFVGTNGSSMKGGNGAEFGGGGGGGYFGGGGGGFSPGIAGGGGGGSSYINPTCFEGKIKIEKGAAVNPGGMSRFPPRSVGEAYWDLQETVVGKGGKGSVKEVHRGSHGGVRIAKPGFFDDMSHHR